MGAAPDVFNLTPMEYSALKVAEMLDTTSWAKDFTWQQMLVIGNYFKPYAIAAGLRVLSAHLAAQGQSYEAMVAAL